MQQFPMMTTINAIIKAAGKEQEFENAPHFHLRIENEPYMALVIESWPVSGPDSFLGETRHISIAHYYTQNGDAMADPEMEITSTGAPVAIKMDGTGYYRRAYWRDEQGKGMMNIYQVKDQTAFMRMWARNLKAQGFVQAAKRQAKAAA